MNGFVRARGLSFKIFDCLQIYFDTIICLSTNTQCRFFHAKIPRFPRRFSHYSRRGGCCRPPKTRKRFSYIFPRPARNIITSYLLLITSYFKKIPLAFANGIFLVPVVGLEPTRYRYQRILSPSRLPIPSHRRNVLGNYITDGDKNQYNF